MVQSCPNIDNYPYTGYNTDKSCMKLEEKGMKKVLLVVYTSLVLCMLTACSKSSVSQKQIEEDILSQDAIQNCFTTDFVSSSEVELTEVEILKRQTNVDEKEDKIYCDIQMKNKYFSATLNAEVFYGYYDEGGWLIDEFNVNDLTIEPIKAPDKELVFDYLIGKIDSTDNAYMKVDCLYEEKEYELNYGELSSNDIVLNSGNTAKFNVVYTSPVLEVHGSYVLTFDGTKWIFDLENNTFVVDDYEADYSEALGSFECSLGGRLEVIDITNDSIEYDMVMTGEAFQYIPSPGHRTDYFNPLTGKFDAKYKNGAVDNILFSIQIYNPINRTWENPSVGPSFR